MRYKFNFIADVANTIVPAVVHFWSFSKMPFSSEEVSVSSGSGFIVSEDGWIVTSAHVFNNKRRIKVELESDSRYDATVKDVDQKMDIALIKTETEYGNSGGPLVNLAGDVIGINALKVAAGIPFAIPMDRIRHFLADSYNRQVNGEQDLMLVLWIYLIQDLKECEGGFPDVSSGVYIYESDTASRDIEA
ncbi:LOW QUALITY PROTEIN: serine protease HTRA4 [Sebastes umbrosus]|uniref:LOW QUALITY PROTEIN: serine protease HTRA4 n=1 Tax=Sebastes umbrosus TaxID=72105 RepID=UPI00189FC7DF|nr:LOW QUALITY PROTEIN: serine protease HTRA4 [Sebastes umbrosus]